MNDAARGKLSDIENYVYGLSSVVDGSPKVSDLVTIHCTSVATESTPLRPLAPISSGVTSASARCSNELSLNDSFRATNKGQRREDYSGREDDRTLTKGRPASSQRSFSDTTTDGQSSGQTSLENTGYKRDGDKQDAEDEDSASSHSIIPWLYDLEADEDQRLLDSEDSGSERKFDWCAKNRSKDEGPKKEDIKEDVQGTEESHTGQSRTPAPVNKATSVNDVTSGKRFLYDDRSRVVKNRSRMRLVSSSGSGSQDSSDSGTSPAEDDRRCPTVRICKTTPGFLRINPREADAEMDPTGGQALLSRTLDQVRRRLIDDLSPVLRDFDDDLKEIESAKLRSTYIKNLLVLSLGFMLVFTSFCALRSLQSSINHDGGLGLAALSCMNATFALGCVFATSIVQRVRPKRAIMLSLIGHLLFTVANVHATFYTLLPATAVIGFTMATLLVAQGTYLTSIAVTYAAVSGKKHDHIVSLFNGFFLFMLQIAQILGNLISSTVFSFLSVERDEESNAAEAEWRTDGRSTGFKANQTNEMSLSGLEANVARNGSICGSGYCHMFLIESMHADIYEDTFVILVAFLCGISATGMVVIGLLLDKLDVIFHKSKQGLVAQLCAIVRLHRDRRMRLCVPLMTFLGIQEAFVYAEFTKVNNDHHHHHGHHQYRHHHHRTWYQHFRHQISFASSY